MFYKHKPGFYSVISKSKTKRRIVVFNFIRKIKTYHMKVKSTVTNKSWFNIIGFDIKNNIGVQF